MSPPQVLRRRKRIALFLATAALIAVATSAWFLLRVKTLAGVVDASFAAINNGDGNALLDNMSDEERAAYGMDAAQWSGFLRNYVIPVMQGWTRVEETSHEFRAETDSFAATHRFFKPNGQTAGIRVEAARTEAGPRSVGLVSNLLTCVGTMKYGDMKVKNERVRMFKAYLDLMARDAATLSGLGLKGIFDISSKRLRPWAEIEEQIARMVKILDKRAATGK